MWMKMCFANRIKKKARSRKDYLNEDFQKDYLK